MTNTHINVGGHKITVNKRDKLWENPSPSSDFAAQTISIPNAGNYDKLIFEFKGHKSYLNKCGFTQVTDTTFTYSSITWNDFDVNYNMAYIYGRAMLATAINSVKFLEAFEWNSSGTKQVDNARMIPLAIYGIKLSN